MQQSICFQSAAQGFISSEDDRTEVGALTKEKKQLGIGVLKTLYFTISNLYIYQLLYCQQHLLFGIQYVTKMKADNDPVGGPVKPLKLV